MAKIVCPINLKKTLSRSHDTILLYAKNKTDKFELNKLPRGDAERRYKNIDNDPRGPWTSGPIQAGPRSESRVYEIITPSGRKVLPPPQYCWRVTKEKFEEMVADNRIYFGPDGDNVPRIKRFLSEVKDGMVATTLWLREDAADNQEGKKEIKELFSDNVFDTPKPERLIERVITLGSNPGDIVLDSFLGSGTTSAVAHKMGRRWIGVELGNHAYTHCAVRMEKVIDGSDKGGVTQRQNWQGGGGFKFYELAPSLLKEDKYGHLVINKEYNADMLAAAMAKQEGFTYSPSEEVYWKQGFSSESDFIYTTTQFITVEALAGIAEQMAEDESLLVCCTAFQKECRNRFSNITIKKIPQMLLGRCEFNHDDYSLNVIEIPNVSEEELHYEEETDIQDANDGNESPASLFD